MSGRDVGEVPFDVRALPARLFLSRLVLRVVFHRVLTLDTPLGRKARATIISKGGPLIRQKRRHLAAAGVEFVPRVAGVRDGRAVLEDGRVAEAANVVWTTGFLSGLEWIQLPVLDADGEVKADARRRPRGRARSLLRRPALPLRASRPRWSTRAARDAERVADVIAARLREAKAMRRTG
jgi:putative flavoprotein involved in K+ transport